MKRILIEKTEKAIREWAKQYPKVELADVEVYPSGIADHIHVIVIASKGLEDWEQTERERDLYNFLRKKLGDENIVKIFLLLTMTEEENDKYVRIHVD